MCHRWISRSTTPLPFPLLLLSSTCPCNWPGPAPGVSEEHDFRWALSSFSALYMGAWWCIVLTLRACYIRHINKTWKRRVFFCPEAISLKCKRTIITRVILTAITEYCIKQRIYSMYTGVFLFSQKVYNHILYFFLSRQHELNWMFNTLMNFPKA